jgi:hypothetical protein
MKLKVLLTSSGVLKRSDRKRLAGAQQERYNISVKYTVLYGNYLWFYGSTKENYRLLVYSYYTARPSKYLLTLAFNIKNFEENTFFLQNVHFTQFKVVTCIEYCDVSGVALHYTSRACRVSNIKI